jgi:hypothetical protein
VITTNYCTFAQIPSAQFQSICRHSRQKISEHIKNYEDDLITFKLKLLESIPWLQDQEMFDEESDFSIELILNQMQFHMIEEKYD